MKIVLILKVALTIIVAQESIIATICSQIIISLEDLDKEVV